MSTSRDYVAGAVLTAAQADDWAQGVLGVNTGTANVGPTSGTTTLDLVTASAVTIAATGRRLRITGQWRSQVGTNAGDKFAFRIQEGATVLSEQLRNIQSITEGHDGGTIVANIASPSAASHTYKMTITRVQGTGTGTVEASSTAPLIITVEDVGTV